MPVIRIEGEEVTYVENSKECTKGWGRNMDIAAEIKDIEENIDWVNRELEVSFRIRDYLEENFNEFAIAEKIDMFIETSNESLKADRLELYRELIQLTDGGLKEWNTL